ncbi:ribosome biogenesis GTPase A [Mycoplasmopsis mustelae]|uniref:Ribosome biogenesis GTPase A n=1 Tax=Mycoplasmopsis mustelae TaxID=171289 RepID=A0A4R7UEK4_9BACT|nr:ribosome biogenesis GTPase YlqF [Mycoplasmopsis mustelae]TDV24303.1 ribosome biogenesis GTPase A [Mycoplasmopsis mustelae]
MQDNYQNLIQWFPGHMAKGFKELKTNAQLADIIIVVLDARCPISSYNEDFDQVAPLKPRLFIVSKSDLMDTSKKTAIAKRFGNSEILWLDLRKANIKNIILKKLKEMSAERIAKNKAKGIISTKIKSFVVGVPNCGKSTLINLLSQKANLKVANYPGVTRQQQWVINKEFLFLDTPGILLPKFDDQEVAIKLLMIGSIKSDIYALEYVCTKIWILLSKYYPQKLQEIKMTPDFDETSIYGHFYEYAQEFNFYKHKGKLDIQKAFKHFLQWVKNLKGVTYD